VSEQIVHELSQLAHHSPITHGQTKFALTIDAGKVVQAKPILGSMHRGAEKLFESRDYRQILMLANRHEWLSAFTGELGIAQLLEEALGIEVPDSAQWFRTLLMEYNRVTAHLAFVAGFPWRNNQIANELRINRELWVEHIAQYTGSRMHPMLTRIGGLSHAPTQSWLNNIPQLISETNSCLEKLEKLMTTELTQYVDLGKLTNSVALDYAVSGPVARASGYQIDLRPTARGLKYSELTNQSLDNLNGDAPARINQLVTEIKQSLIWLSELTPICVTKVSDPINVLLPKVLRVPEGDYTHEIETPLGIASWLLVSQNDKMPYRLKLRPASLNTLLVTEKVLLGVPVEQVDTVLASLPFISGDVDR
jgi:NADH-quinone oxidoreductase subunit D